MKFSKTMMALMGAFALTVAGCKYDDAAGADADALANKDMAAGSGIDTVEGVYDTKSRLKNQARIKNPRYLATKGLNLARCFLRQAPIHRSSPSLPRKKIETCREIAAVTAFKKRNAHISRSAAEMDPPFGIIERI